MQRIPEWPAHLEWFVVANRSRVWQYGEWDCFQFARQAILAMTAEDLAASFRPYASRLGYLRQMVRYCQSTSLLAFAEKLLSSFGSFEVPSSCALRGDLVLAGEDPAFGVVALNGRHVLALSEAGEIVRLPVCSVITAWRI